MGEIFFKNPEKKQERTLQELIDAGKKTDSIVIVTTEEALTLINAGARVSGTMDDPGLKTQKYSFRNVYFIWIAHNTDEAFPTHLGPRN